MNKTTKRFFKLISILFFLILFLLLIKNISFLFPSHTEVFPSMKKEAIHTLVFTDDKNKVKVEKKNNQWTITDFPADVERIDSVIDALVTLKKDEVVSQNKNKYADFAVDGGRKIEFDRHVVYVGSSAGTSQSYFRIDKDTLVYKAHSELLSLFSLKDLQDLNTHLIQNEEAVERLTLSWGQVEWVAIKKKNEWAVNSKKALKERMNFLINDIKTLKGDEIFKKDEIDLAQYLIGMTISVKENEENKQAAIYIKDIYPKDKTTYYFYQKDSAFIYKIPPAYFDSLKKEEKDLIK